MNEDEMLKRVAFLRECANKEAEDAFANGGKESYDAIQQAYDQQIQEEWKQFQKGKES